MSFVIKKESQSFKYLSKWKDAYKAFSRDGSRLNSWGDPRNLASDFCSYYRDVFKLMLCHFLILLVIPSALIGVLLITGIIYISPTYTFVGTLWVLSSLPAGVVCIFGMAFGIVYFGDHVLGPTVNYIRNHLPERKVRGEEEDKPSVIKTWYDGFKGNYCHTINYEVEKNDQVVHAE